MLVMVPTLRIRLLGDFHLMLDDQVITSVISPRVQSLLAYLVLHSQTPLSRQRLAFLFWPDSTEDQARTNLRQTLHLLRQALPDSSHFFQSDGQMVQWLPNSPFTLDVAEFEEAIQQAESAMALQQAVGLYQGELLAGWYDDWVLPERERLQQQFIGALERLIRLFENQNDYRSAIQYAERLLRSDPLREETYQLLIRLHARGSDRTGALRAYQTCATVLKRELSVEPSPETQATYEESLNIETSSARLLSSPHQRTNNLPAYLTSFIGRKDELARLKSLLSWQDATLSRTRLITLTGAGGCGKTRLAVELATQLIETFPDGVWFVDLSPLTNPTLIPQSIAAVLEVQEQSGRALPDTLSNFLQPKQLLLVLDNCEHLVAACAQVVQSLLQACPRLGILATSIEKFNVMGEKTWAVSSLSLPDAHAPLATIASRSDAVNLFVERACSVLPTFTLNAGNAAAVVQICQHLDGVPLAIELAAARVSLLTPEQIAARLDHAFQLLMRGGYTTRPHHQTLRATMDWSYELLSRQERRLLRRLAIFAGGFTLDAVEQVCADQAEQDDVPRSVALDLLSRLIDKSLVMPMELKLDQMYYRLLEPTRQYASEKLGVSGEAERLATRHLEFFLSLAEEAEPHFRQAEQVAWFNRLVADHNNLMSALDWSLKHGELISALRLTGALWYFWMGRGYYSEGLRQLLQALSLTQGAAPSIARAKALWAAGAITLWSEGDWSRALPFLEEAATTSRELGNKRILAGSLGELGEGAFLQGDYTAARALLAESLALLRELNDHHGMGWSLTYLGDVSRAQHDDEQAERLYTEGIDQFKAIGDINSAGYAVRRLGALVLNQGDYRWANELFKESLGLNKTLDYPKGVAACLGAMAELASRQGHLIRVARLLGAVEALLSAVAGKLFPTDQAEYDHTVATLRARLDQVSLDAAWAEGRAMTAQQAIDYALSTE
jgi:predicted ATPase/DNA-binding SARP family transcriptional activator